MTKTLRRALLPAIILMAFCLFPTQGYARSGNSTLGVGAGYASGNDGAYTSLFYQYSFARHVRIAPDVSYIFRHRNLSGFAFNADMHFPLNLTKGINLYPLAGVAFNTWNYKEGSNTTRLGLNFGAGFDFRFTPSFKLTVQYKYTLAKDVGSSYVGMGVGYCF